MFLPEQYISFRETFEFNTDSWLLFVNSSSLVTANKALRRCPWS